MKTSNSVQSAQSNNRLISLFLPSLAGGGAERVILNLAGYISCLGVPTDLLVASSMGEYRTKIPDKIRLYDLGSSKPIKVIPKLIQYLRLEKPSVLLATITNAVIAALIAVKFSMVSTKCVVREASTLSVEINKSSGINRIMLPYFIKILYAYSSAIVAPSQGVADDLSNISRVLSKKIHVIPNPIVSASLLEKSKANPEHQWFKNTHRPVIIGMGRLTVQKDFITLIKAFSLLRQHREIKLIILGEGDQRTALEKLISKKALNQDVSLPGFIENPYPYLSNASVFVLSSRWEGLPGVLIEALACGTKVVSTDCPYGPREILDNGRYGQLVPVGDYRAMATAIDRVLSGKFNAADPKPQAELYDLDKNSRKYMRLLLN